MSRHKPSGLTDLTRTEQLALTSHRVSATSMLIRTASKENICPMYSGNLLSRCAGCGKTQDYRFRAALNDDLTSSSAKPVHLAIKCNGYRIWKNIKYSMNDIRKKPACI
uniref:Nuclear receptor domain-containing protein n=1 Tax=Heterorhabditis bacteriophora TaxID=37862 RepID=A0A1I7XMT4_HETBA